MEERRGTLDTTSPASISIEMVPWQNKWHVLSVSPSSVKVPDRPIQSVFSQLYYSKLCFFQIEPGLRIFVALHVRFNSCRICINLWGQIYPFILVVQIFLFSLIVCCNLGAKKGTSGQYPWCYQSFSGVFSKYQIKSLKLSPSSSRKPSRRQRRARLSLMLSLRLRYKWSENIKTFKMLIYIF